MLSVDLGDERFENAQFLIEKKYSEMELKIQVKFHQAFFNNDQKAMKKYLSILSNFKGYQNCINEFIKNCQLSLKNSTNLLSELVPLCRKTNDIINEVFLHNEKIMEQFVKDLFLGKVQVVILDIVN